MNKNANKVINKKSEKKEDNNKEAELAKAKDEKV